MNVKTCSSGACCRAVKQHFHRCPCGLPWKRTFCKTFRSQDVLRAKQTDNTEAAALEAPLLNALTAIGLSGTIAVTGASLCGIQVFSLFQWDQADIFLALQINSALLLLEAVLLAPSYSIPSSFMVEQNLKSDSISSQQQQHIDLDAVKLAGLWSADSWLLMLALYRAVLRKPLTEQLPKQVIVGLLLARETSKELLQRGFLLTALAGWLTDRFYEADLGDVITLNPGGLDVTLPQLGLWTASLVATAVFAPAALIAAEEAAESVSGALLLKSEVGQAVAAAAAAAGSTRQSSSSSDSTSGLQHVQADGADETHTVSSHEDDDVVLDPDVLEYRLFKATEDCVASSPPKIAYGVTLLKELARIMLANASFVLTNGNLAASWTCSVLLNSMLLLYGARVGKQSRMMTVDRKQSS